MNIIEILNNKEIKDIPILYILRIINVIQEDNIKNGQSSSVGKKLSKNNE